MYYPEFRNTIHWLTAGRDHYAITRDEDKALLEGLFDGMKPVKANDNGWKSIFIALERGPEPDSEECHEMVEMGDYPSEAEYLESWREYNHEDMRFFEISLGENDEGFRMVFINHRCIFESDPRGYDGFRSSDIRLAWGDELQEPLRSLTAEVQKSVQKALDGSYNAWIKKELPMRNRVGRIRRSDIWAAFPGLKEGFLEGLTAEEVKAFADAVDKGFAKRENIGRIEKMTSGLFFRACAAGYRAVGESEYGLRLRADTDKGLYEDNADGRDDGLTKLPEDDSSAFYEWSHGKKQFNGGHPWEVCRGGNSTHVDFYPIEDEKGWCFGVRGKHRMFEVVRFFLAISEAGFPVYVADDEAIRDGVLGRDTVGIVPEGVFPRYCESWFPGENVTDFMNLDQEDEENEAFMLKAIFDDPELLELEGETKEKYPAERG